MELKDRVVLVTGGSDGIGAEAAKLFAQKGCHVAITYNSQKKKAEDISKECKKFRDSVAVHLDINSEDSINDYVESVIDKFGAIDILVNNAGVAIWKEFQEQSLTHIDNQVNTNLKGLIKMTKAVLPYMQGQEEGMIINLGSGAGKTGYSILPVYCATKFGVRGFTQALSQGLPKGIKICTLNPGMTSTKMTNFQGVPAKDVAEIIVKTASEKIKPDKNLDIDVWDYV